MSKNERLDPRVRRTRKWLQQALQELIKEKDYQSISIAEITDRADVARPTFYLHYSSKDDLLLSFLDEMFDEYVEEINEVVQLGGGLMATKLFEQVQNHNDLIMLVLNAETPTLLLERLQKYIESAFRMFIMQNLYPVNDLNEDILDLAITSTAGASYALIIRWIKKGMPYPPEVMGKLLLDLTRPGLLDVLVNQSTSDILRTDS